MFERFTDRARRVVVQAQVEARELRHNYIGTEHLLLGLIDENEGLAVKALRGLGVDPRAVAGQVRELVGQGTREPGAQHIPFTPRAKKVLELSLQEALRLKHNYIGTEHLLLAIVHQAEGPAYEVLTASGVDLDTARAQVTKLLGEYAVSVSGQRFRAPEHQLDLAVELHTISRRLAAIEAKLGIEPSAAEKRLRQLEIEIAKVRKDKIAAIDAKDMDAAAGHRQQERRLLGLSREARMAWLEEEDNPK